MGAGCCPEAVAPVAAVVAETLGAVTAVTGTGPGANVVYVVCTAPAGCEVCVVCTAPVTVAGCTCPPPVDIGPLVGVGVGVGAIVGALVACANSKVCVVVMLGV